MRYVILGGSIGGLSAARAIREQDGSGEIVLVSAEPCGPYFRPLIPLLIDGSKLEADLFLPDEPLKQLAVNVSYRSAERVDTKKKTIYLSGRKKLAYDKLLIATGARPALPKIPGLGPDRMLVMRTMSDAQALARAAKEARQVVVIGGGMVGIKTATALRHLPDPPDVTIVEQEDHILPLRLDQEAAAIVHKALEKEGISCAIGTNVQKAAAGKNGQMTLTLKGGKKLTTDLVVAAVGVKPNIEFLHGSGIKTRVGVLVDDRLMTSVKDVYAAGDAAECREATTGKTFTSPLWTNAVDMGKQAGRNMAGGKAEGLDVLPVMNAAEIAGIPMISAGLVEPGQGFEIELTRTNGSLRKVVMQKDRVVGMSFLGDIRNAGVYVSMIRHRIPVTGSRERFLKGLATYADVAVGRD